MCLTLVPFISVIELRQSGLIDYWQQLWYPKVACSGIPIPESHAITLMDTQSAFYLLLVGVVMAVIVLGAELAWRRRCRQRRCGAASGQHHSHHNGSVTMADVKLHNGSVVHSSTTRDLFRGDYSQQFASMETLFH